MAGLFDHDIKPMDVRELSKVPDFASYDSVRELYEKHRNKSDRVIVVIDDDPTGIQTVNGIDVYMGWSKELVLRAFEKGRMFYIQTNSRSMKACDSKRVNGEIMENIIEASDKTGRDFSVISRCDSTLRGHYPLETSVLKDVYEHKTGKRIDGEIFIPFFFEAGRVTYGDVHYVQEGGYLIPAGQTEFAKDKVFAFENSNLKYFIEEKTKGRYSHENVISVSIEMIRNMDVEGIANLLLSVKDFGKVIVNALCYEDLMVFTSALIDAENHGKRFLFRTAASFVKTYGFIKDKLLLDSRDFKCLSGGGKNQVLVIVGSHIRKSTLQLEKLLCCERVLPVELDVNSIIKDENTREKEIRTRLNMINMGLKSGKNPVLYTSRKLITADSANKEDNFLIYRAVSDALSEIVRLVEVRPDCVISKGGITSSDVAVKGLGISKAEVLGQILPGVPVILAGDESKWPGIPYVIFPGNVGGEEDLKTVYEKIAG